VKRKKAAKAKELLAERWRLEQALTLEPVLQARAPQESRKRKPTGLLPGPEQASPQVENPQAQLKALMQGRPAAKLPELTPLQRKLRESLAHAKNNLHPPRSPRA
jgi:hypothetical protein